MFKVALPILGVSSSEAAEEFYCGKLGFERIYAYRPNPAALDPCYMGVVRDEAHIVVSSFEGDGPPGARNVQIYVEDIAAIYEEYKQVGISVSSLMDQTWGNLEFGFVDPDGNRLCMAENKGS
jgi:catechol 2,3-dioxygenase-like lactoylglutathione lyase family enzyme